MTALGMRLRLDRLRRAYRLSVAPVTIPFTQPTARAQVLTGYAATRDTDLHRQQLGGWVFGPVHRHDPPPLYYKHDKTRAVGTIDHLTYDNDGALLISATVTDTLARRANAFSVGCTVLDYEIINADTPDFYALIRRCLLNEVSLTDTPANPNAIVSSRRDVSAQSEFYGHASSAIARISQMVALLQKENQQCRTSP